MDPPIHQASQFAGQRQAEPQAGPGVRQRLVVLVEAVEQPLAVAHGHARACVGDGDAEPRRAGLGAQANTPFRGEFDRVIKQFVDDPAQPIDVAHGRSAGEGSGRPTELQATAPGSVRSRFEGAL